jgi:hypothetical protein
MKIHDIVRLAVAREGMPAGAIGTITYVFGLDGGCEAMFRRKGLPDKTLTLLPSEVVPVFFKASIPEIKHAGS